MNIARRSAVKARTAAMAQIKNMLVTAPAQIRSRYAGMSDTKLITRLAGARLAPAICGTEPATQHALRTLARRYRYLEGEIDQPDTDLEQIIRRLAPALLAAKGVGTPTAARLLVTAGDNPDRLTGEASFTAVCGAAPIPASSGKITRFRLNRGGDRQANAALHQIVLSRLASDPRTQDYAARRRSQGKSDREIIRCLKRAVAREVYHLLTNPPEIPKIDDLRPLRHERGRTLQQAADHFRVWPARISEIERGKARDDTLATAYRHWLLSA